MAALHRAYQMYVEDSKLFWGYDSKHRMGKHAAAKRTLVETAKQVSAHRKAQNNIKTRFRLVCKTRYEKKYPGRIARMGPDMQEDPVCRQVD